MPGTHHLTTRYRRQELLAHQRAAIDHALRQAITIAARSGEGDPHRLRGIPAIGRGVGGAIPGTNPERTITR